MDISTTSVNEVSTFAKIIKEYGMEVVIVAVFIGLFILMMKYLIKVNDQNTERLNKLQEEMLQMMKNELAEMKTVAQPHQEKSQNILEIFVQLDSSIRDIITEIRATLDCDRISVYAFHNGTHASHGFPFFKISCITEQVKRASGVMAVMKDQIAIPLSMFDDFFYDLYKLGHVEVEDIDKIKDKYPMVYSLLAKNNIHSASTVAIFNSNNDILGIILVEYKDIKSEYELDVVKGELIKISSNLAPILDYSKYQKYQEK